jgi:hypothetical protein
MISAFEYVVVLISIVLGLGIAQVLTGIADLVHQSKRVTLYWPHLLWIVIILLLHVQDWWVTFDLRNHEPWRLPTFLLVMTYPVTLFILARLLFPFGISEGAINLKEFYLDNYRKIFVFASGLPILSMIDALVVRSGDMSEQLPKIGLTAFLIFMCVRKKPSPEWIHQLIALVLFAILVVTIIIEWNKWLIIN